MTIDTYIDLACFLLIWLLFLKTSSHKKEIKQIRENLKLTILNPTKARRRLKNPEK